MLKAVLVLSLAMLSGCATVISGTSQVVTVSTLPGAASCTVYRAGEPAQSITLTPGNILLRRDRKSLTITCAKEGYQTVTAQQKPEFSGVMFGNFAFLPTVIAPIGFIVDGASGASFHYPSEIRLGMLADPAFRPRPATLDPALDNGFAQPVTGVRRSAKHPR